MRKPKKEVTLQSIREEERMFKKLPVLRTFLQAKLAEYEDMLRDYDDDEMDWKNICGEMLELLKECKADFDLFPLIRLQKI